MAVYPCISRNRTETSCSLFSGMEDVGDFSRWDGAIDLYINGILNAVDVEQIKKNLFKTALIRGHCGHIICHIHFRFPDGSQLEEAFTYDWRIWSMPELRDILKEVGFKKIVAWWDCEDDIIRPRKEVENLVSWVAYLAAWK